MLRATKFGSPNLFFKMSFAFAYPSLPPKIAQFLMAALACPDVNCSSLANLLFCPLTRQTVWKMSGTEADHLKIVRAQLWECLMLMKDQ